MKRLLLIVIAAVAAGCGSSPIAPAPSSPAAVPPAAPAFRVTGLIFDASGGVVADAHLELVESSGARRTTSSDDRGFYRFEGVFGNVILSASKADYYAQVLVKYVSTDAIFDLKLQRIKRLIIGEVFRDVVDGPPYDPVAWDAKAPCARILLVAPETGTVDVVLTWEGKTDLDLLVPGVGYWNSQGGVVRASFAIRRDMKYELVVNSYYAVVPFELRGALRTAN